MRKRRRRASRRLRRPSRGGRGPRALAPSSPPADPHTWARMEAAWIVSLPPFTTVPAENIKAAIKLLASKCRTAPHVVWTGWRISAVLFDWRILLQDGLLKRGGAARSDG